MPQSFTVFKDITPTIFKRREVPSWVKHHSDRLNANKFRYIAQVTFVDGLSLEYAMGRDHDTLYIGEFGTMFGWCPPIFHSIGNICERFGGDHFKQMIYGEPGRSYDVLLRLKTEYFEMIDGDTPLGRYLATHTADPYRPVAMNRRQLVDLIIDIMKATGGSEIPLADLIYEGRIVWG